MAKICQPLAIRLFLANKQYLATEKRPCVQGQNRFLQTNGIVRPCIQRNQAFVDVVQVR